MYFNCWLSIMSTSAPLLCLCIFSVVVWPVWKMWAYLMISFRPPSHPAGCGKNVAVHCWSLQAVLLIVCAFVCMCVCVCVCMCVRACVCVICVYVCVMCVLLFLWLLLACCSLCKSFFSLDRLLIYLFLLCKGPCAQTEKWHKKNALFCNEYFFGHWVY